MKVRLLIEVDTDGWTDDEIRRFVKGCIDQPDADLNTAGLIGGGGAILEVQVRP